MLMDRSNARAQLCAAAKALLIRRAALIAAAALACSSAAYAADTTCAAGTLYLTFDTGNMRHAELIAEVLKRHEVKASFFLADEATYRGDTALDPQWAGFWKSLAAQGHVFGSHTLRHGKFLGDNGGASGSVRYRPQFGAHAGQVISLDADGVCRELQGVDQRFRSLTGRGLDPVWRAPGGRTTPFALSSAQACGYRHVHWAKAGFLGDELASDAYPNAMLLERALKNLRSGDIIMAHLGIWSRQDPFAPMFDPLIRGLKSQGFCFQTLPV